MTWAKFQAFVKRGIHCHGYYPGVEVITLEKAAVDRLRRSQDAGDVEYLRELEELISDGVVLVIES